MKEEPKYNVCSHNEGMGRIPEQTNSEENGDVWGSPRNNKALKRPNRNVESFKCPSYNVQTTAIRRDRNEIKASSPNAFNQPSH
jgi:hypothetical protein